MRDELSPRINRLFQKGKWAEARNLLSKALRQDPEDHWLLTRIGTTYYEEQDYAKALEYHQQAYALAPDCPLVLWDLAGTLQMLGRLGEAVQIYDRLIAKGLRNIAEDECGEGVTWAGGVLTDTLFRLGDCYLELGLNKLALLAFVKHGEMRLLGAHSLYTNREFQANIRELKRRDPELLDRELAHASSRLELV